MSGRYHKAHYGSCGTPDLLSSFHATNNLWLTVLQDRFRFLRKVIKGPRWSCRLPAASQPSRTGSLLGERPGDRRAEDWHYLCSKALSRWGHRAVPAFLLTASDLQEDEPVRTKQAQRCEAGVSLPPFSFPSCGSHRVSSMLTHVSIRSTPRVILPTPLWPLPFSSRCSRWALRCIQSQPPDYLSVSCSVPSFTRPKLPWFPVAKEHTPLILSFKALLAWTMSTHSTFVCPSLLPANHPPSTSPFPIHVLHLRSLPGLPLAPQLQYFMTHAIQLWMFEPLGCLGLCSTPCTACLDQLPSCICAQRDQLFYFCHAHRIYSALSTCDLLLAFCLYGR